MSDLCHGESMLLWHDYLLIWALDKTKMTLGSLSLELNLLSVGLYS